MIKKLRIKFILINMFFVAIILSGFLAVLATYDTNRFESNMRGVIREAVYSPDKFSNNYKIFIYKERINLVIANLDKSNNLIEFTKQYGEVDTLKANKALNIVINRSNNIGKIEDLKIIYVVKETDSGRYIGLIDISHIPKLVRELFVSNLYVAMGAFFVFFVLSIYLSYYITRPIDKSIKQQKEFVASASHELKTPITVLLANLSLLSSQKSTLNNDTIRYLNNLQDETTRMYDLIKDLLFLASSDFTKDLTVKTSLKLNDIVNYCVLNYEVVAFESNVQFSYSITNKEVYILGNEDQLKQLIIILLDNAFTHSGDQPVIELTLSVSNDIATITVKNSGIPIPKDELKNIFKRFYKCDKSRTRFGSSTGLGLSIAKEIVAIHKGRIIVSSSEVNGTTFEVKIPLEKQNHNQ